MLEVEPERLGAGEKQIQHKRFYNFLSLSENENLFCWRHQINYMQKLQNSQNPVPL